MAWLIVLGGLWAIFNHLATERARNFANLAPWTDLLFGTYHRPEGREDWPPGLPQPFPRSDAGMLLAPFGGARKARADAAIDKKKRNPLIREISISEDGEAPG